MKTTTGSLVIRGALALSVLFMASLAASCKSPLFGLGGQVDTAVPSISVSEVEEGGTPRTLVNGDYVRGTITLRGKASDDLGLASVALSFEDNGATIRLDATIDAAAQSWSATVVTTDYLDGDKDFTVTVTDTAGKASTTRFVLYFDNKPPTVLLTVPSKDEGTASDALYGTIDIKGSAADQFGIRKVRVYVYDSNKTLLYTSPDDASIGTNSFALRLDTSSLLGESGAEIGYIYVRAWDRSGNTNVQFYRLDELKALNANLGATVEELHALETGSATSANGITLAQAAGARRYQPGTGYADAWLIGYSFDQSSNLPIITISNPEQGKAVNLLSKSAKAMGIVQDANGVALVELQFRSGAQVSGWYSDAIPGDEGTDGDLEVSGTGRVVNWSSKVLYESFPDSGFGALDVASYDLRIRATDGDGNVRTSDWVPFTIDADVPYVEISDPKPGDYEGGDPIVISGMAKSYGTTNVSEVAVSINGVFDYQAATIPLGQQDVSWSFDLTSALVPEDGTYTIKARVRDSGSKEALYNIVVTIDRTPPHDLAFSSPAKGSSINGYPVLRGQAKDNILLKEVYLVLEKPGEENKLNDTYNWSYELDAGSFANTDYGYEVSTNVYRVPFRIKAVDEAGNASLSPAFGADPDHPAVGSYYLDVDLDGDYPEISTIISPGDQNASDAPYVITGSIKVQGTATDDDRLHSVEMALVARSGATESWRSLASGSLYAPVAPNSFYPVTGTSLWSQVLNDGGELYALSDFAGHAGDFRIIVRAVDTKDLVSVNPDPDLSGDEKTVYVRFDNTLPGVINLLPEEGTMRSGTFPLTFTAQDNVRVVLAQISYNNGSNYSDLAIAPAASIPLTVSVNTKTVNSNVFNTSSGTLYMRIRLKDDGNNITEKSFKYLVDNIAPVDVTPPSSTTMMNISNRMYTDAGASLAEILGTVKDTGTVRGIDRVEAYFERDGKIYKLKPNEAAEYVTAADYTFTNGSFPYTTDDAYKIIINKAENYVDVDGDGYQESLTEGTTGHTWGARFDSSKISDGDVTIHYVAWDQAGNSSHFSVPGSVRNNPPVLTSITLGTNLNGDTTPADAIDDGERVRLTKQADGTWRGYTLDADGDQLGAERAYNLDDPILTVRNSRFTFAATVTGGNPALSYRALAPNGTGALLDWVASASYDVTNFTINGWAEDAVNTLSIQARDSAYGTSLETEELSFRVRVNNADGTAPLISLAPVGARYAEPAASQSLSYAARAEQAVAAYADNLLWVDANSDTICSWDERLGHVELPADSLYNELDADVSGTIKLRGKVYDDQRVSRITAALSVGFDTNGTAAGGAVAAGAETELAAFSGGSLSVVAARQAAMDPASNTLAFALDGKNAPELSDELGHAMNYTLTWNTAFITGVAANNVVVTIRAYNADGSLSSAAARTVDVVPYINGIATSIDTMLGASFNRSATGKYTVRVKSSATAEYETITINGFNLKPTNLVAGSESDIRLSIDEDGYDDTYVVKQGTGLAASGLSSDYTSLSATVQATGSGFLTVITNGVPSINNSNAQTASYNREDSLIQEYLSDDRYLSLWDFTPLRANAGAPYAKNAIYPSMAMAGNVPQFAYVNNSGGYGLAQFWSGSAEVKIYENWDLFTYSSLALNDDNGRAALFDVNIVQSGTDFIGDKGGIMVNMIYNPPDTTWSGTTYYYRDYNLWLDNLYKSGNLAVLGRYQYPTIKLVGTDVLSHAFYSVYDSIDDRVIFRYFRIGTNQTSVGGGSTTYATKITDSATNLYVNNTDLVQRNQNGTWPTYTNNAINNTRLGQNNDSGNTNAGQYFATGTDVGLHTAVAGISTGTLTARAILVYYSANKLYYQYATNDANTEWSTPVPLDSSVGADYVSMIVDDNDHVHIAYQDSFSGDVKYIYIPNYLVPATRKMVTVDSYMTIGSKLTLTVPTGGSVPYIAYKGLGNTAKIAWYTATPAIATLEDGVDAADRFTGAWEVQILPSTIVDSDTNRFNVGVGIDGRPVVGYANNKPGSQGIEYLTGLGELAD